MSPGIGPDKRWSKERKLAYGRRMVKAFVEGKLFGEKTWPVYPTEIHVRLFFWDAFAPVADDDSGGYGLLPEQFGAPEGTSVEEGVRLLEEVRIGYVQSVHPDDVRTPGSEKWQKVEDAGGKHGSQFDPWKPGWEPEFPGSGG